MSADKKSGGAEILVPPANPDTKPKAGGVFRPDSATFNPSDNSVLVSLKGGGTVTIPPGAKIMCNGFVNVAVNVPAWLVAHASETKKVEEENKARAALGQAPLDPVPPIRLIFADTEDGLLARFDQ